MTIENNQTTILLSRFEYAHIRDKNSGELNLIEGPRRVQLESNQELDGDKRRKVLVSDGKYAIVLNPFDTEKNDIVEGDREVRIGPATFSLHPGERLLDDKVKNEYVLTDSDGLLLRAKKECPDPLAEGGDSNIPAGTKVLLKGPRRFIPHKDIEILERRRALSLSENQGVYVQNDDSGAVRLVRGPEDFFLAHNESFWDKELEGAEEEALGYREQRGLGDSRVLAATPRDRENLHGAIVIELEDNEAICLFDADNRRVEFGPKKIFLEPHERTKVLFISGDVPVRPNVLRIAKLSLGPDFIRDQLTVRTRDNALLTLEITAKWEFRVDSDHPEKLFAHKDFVGFAAKTLRSEIREAAAKHDFETFHSGASTIVKQAVFGEDGSERVFSENGLVILGIDVESVTPNDPEIATKLTDTIKTTVDIVTRRQQEEAQLESERRLIEGKARNEEQRKELVTLELENQRTKKLGDADVEAEAALKLAKSEAEATTVRAEAEAKAERSKRKAVADVELEELRERAAVFAGEGGERLIALEQARALKATDKLIVPASATLALGIDKIIDVNR